MLSSSSSRFSLLSCVIILSLLPLLATARPCKTLFITYYSITTSTPSTSTSSADPTTSRFFSVYRIVPLVPRRHRLHSLPDPNPSRFEIAASIQDRAKDILIVVAGLLFGLGCGAIVASTMYLVWSMATNRSNAYGYDDESGSDVEESPKKMGYVMITAAADPDPVKAVKEGYEGNHGPVWMTGSTSRAGNSYEVTSKRLSWK